MAAGLLRRFLRRLFGGLTPALLLFLLLLGSLWLMSEATRDAAYFGGLYSVLVAINTAGLLLLVALIGHNLYRLLRQYRAGEPGAHLTGRLVVVFVLLALVPVVVVYNFSLQFLHRGIDSWFDVRIEAALEDALELGQLSLDGRMRELLNKTEALAERLEEPSDNLVAIAVDDLRLESNARELSLMSLNGPILAVSNADPTVLVPDRPGDGVLVQLRQGHTYAGLEPDDDGGLVARVAVPVGVGSRFLQAIYPMSARINELTEGVQAAYEQYKQLAYLRQPLKFGFTLTLSLVLLVSVLAAVWAAFFSARRLVAPIRDLAEGTRAVAEGDYDKQLVPAGHDELGFLVRSFNEMTRRLSRARDQAARSKEQVEQQRAYLQAVLGQLSSGVMTLSAAAKVQMVNEAAGQILGLPLKALSGRTPAESAADHPHLEALAELLGRMGEQGRDDWSEVLTLFGAGGRQVLMCRGAPLHGGGRVVVFDDVTALVQAQRNAAWGEVARRLAHEIKNPLTPIQLSAERLRHKYLAAMARDQAGVLDRATQTIIHQVEALKGMVDAFRDYARAPQLHLAPLELNALLEEVVELYRGDPGLDLELHLDSDLPRLEADANRMRQLLHNLLKNAREAMEGVETPRLTVATRCAAEAGCRHLELGFEDHGPGFPAEILDQLFEPYVTTKPRGSGLGLAIVKKIVEEHGGVIRVENLEGGGARTIIRFPVTGGGE